MKGYTILAILLCLIWNFIVYYLHLDLNWALLYGAAGNLFIILSVSILDYLRLIYNIINKEK